MILQKRKLELGKTKQAWLLLRQKPKVYPRPNCPFHPMPLGLRGNMVYKLS